MERNTKVVHCNFIVAVLQKWAILFLIKKELLLNHYVYYKIKQYFINIVRRLWFIYFKLNWNKLWIRKNEFHSSLDMDIKMMMIMNSKEREKYLINLNRRRNIAHNRDVKK
jgi:hypothetical protein